jgi:acylglycerol lipase
MTSTESNTTESTVTFPDGLKVYTKTWSPPADAPAPPVAQALLLHGFSDHSNCYYTLPPHLASKSILFTSFDQRGWGRTAPEKSQWGATGPTTELLEDTDRIVTMLLDQQPGLPLFLLGHSMGGATALTYAHSGQHRRELAGVAVWGPMIDFAPESRPFALTLAAGRLAARVLPGKKVHSKLDPKYLSRDEDVQEGYSADPLCHDTCTLEGIKAMLDRGKALQREDVLAGFAVGLPVLVMHGTGDKITNWKESKKLVEGLKVKDKTWLEYEGWYHKCEILPRVNNNTT